MFKKSKNYQRRYNMLLRVDAVDEIVEQNGIDSYKPSKCTSVADTLVDSVDEYSVFNSKSNSNYEYDMDLLEFAGNTEATKNTNDLGGNVELDEDNNSDDEVLDTKSSNLIIIGGVVLGVIATIIVNILM